MHHSPTPQQEKEKPFVSWGTRIHNEITYRGVDWLLNSSIGVAFAYWTARTKNGEKYFGKPVGNFFRKILKPILKDPATIEEGAKWGTTLSGIMAGGTAIIPPMMILENKDVKCGMIRTFDETIYGKDVVANDPKFDQCYDNVKQEPNKSFAAGMGARFIALAPIMLLTTWPKTNMPLIKYVYDPIGKCSKWAATKVGIKPGKMLIEGLPEHLDGNPASPKQLQSNWDFLHRTIGFDFGLTLGYSVMHEAAYKALAGWGTKPDAPAANAPNATLAKSPVEENAALVTLASRELPRYADAKRAGASASFAQRVRQESVPDQALAL